MILEEILALYNIEHVCIYLRKSRGEDEIENLKNHENILVQLCQKYHLSYQIKFEIGSSDTIKFRNVFEQIIEDVRCGIFDAIAVVDLDRLSRNIADFEQIKQILALYKIIVLTPEELYDFNNVDQDRKTDIKAFIASAEYKMIKRRLKIGKVEGAKQGHWVNGVAPLGYNYNKTTKRLEINEKDAEIIRLIFNQYLNGKSIINIMCSLNQEGLRTKCGKLFNTVLISRILNNEVYIGNVVYEKTRGSGHKNRLTKPFEKFNREDWIITENAHPPIIDKSIFLKVKEILKMNRKMPERGKTKICALTGLIKCGICGAGLTFHYKKYASGERYNAINPCWRIDKVSGIKCINQGIVMLSVEKIVIDKVKQYKEKMESDYEKLYEDKLEEKDISILDNNIKNKEKELDILKMELEEIYEKFEIGIYSPIEFFERKEKYKNSIKEIVSEIEVLKEKGVNISNFSITEKIQNIDMVLNSYSQKLSESERNRLLKLIIKKIEYKRVTNREPEIKVYFLNEEDNEENNFLMESVEIYTAKCYINIA